MNEKHLLKEDSFGNNKQFTFLNFIYIAIVIFEVLRTKYFWLRLNCIVIDLWKMEYKTKESMHRTAPRFETDHQRSNSSLRQAKPEKRLR